MGFIGEFHKTVSLLRFLFRIINSKGDCVICVLTELDIGGKQKTVQYHTNAINSTKCFIILHCLNCFSWFCCGYLHTSLFVYPSPWINLCTCFFLPSRPFPTIFQLFLHRGVRRFPELCENKTQRRIARKKDKEGRRGL